jgi:hypothetical protein
MFDKMFGCPETRWLAVAPLCAARVALGLLLALKILRLQEDE